MKYFFRIFVVLTFICVIIFVFFKFVRIKNIKCSSQYDACDKDLVTSINNLKSKNENVLSMRSDLQNLVKKDKNVLQYRIDLNLPFDLRVYIVERNAIAAFSLANGEFALIGMDGTILENVKETSLPKITSYYNLNGEELGFVSNLMDDLNRIYKVGSGKVDANGFEVDGIKERNVIFPLSGDRDVLLGSLNLILSRLPSLKEASTIKFIDLRFKNPVLR